MSDLPVRFEFQGYVPATSVEAVNAAARAFKQKLESVGVSFPVPKDPERPTREELDTPSVAKVTHAHGRTHAWQEDFKPMVGEPYKLGQHASAEVIENLLTGTRVGDYVHLKAL